MKTVDTTKLWMLVPATLRTWPEIVGPGGIQMDCFETTTEQAQEITDILNASTGEGQILTSAMFEGNYTITLREGDLEVIYSAPAADEVMWMAAQGERREEATEPKVTINVSGSDPKMVEKMLNSDIQPEPPTPYCYSGGRQYGKTHAMHEHFNAVHATLSGRIVELTNALENAERALGVGDQTIIELREGEKALVALLEAAEKRAATMQHERAAWEETATQRSYERKAWEETAATFARNSDFYQGLVDACAKHLGVEAFTADDGGIHNSPIRLKVPELVEKLAAERIEAKDKLASALKRVEQLNEQSRNFQSRMGVGSGSGNLFVYGTHEAIKAAQGVVTRVEGLAKNNDILQRDIDKMMADREVLSYRGNLLDQCCEILKVSRDAVPGAIRKLVDQESLPEMVKARAKFINDPEGYRMIFRFDDLSTANRALAEWNKFYTKAKS